MISVCYKVRVGGQYVVGRDYLGRADELLAHYTRLERLRCCDVQGGFFIDIDGKPWSDEGTVDELWMTATWVTALAKLTSDAPSEPISCTPWEESRLKLRRNAEKLVMVDIHFSGNVSMRRVELPLSDFLEKMLPEVEVFHELSTEIVAAARAELSAGRTAQGLRGVLEEIGSVVEHETHLSALETLRATPHWDSLPRA